MMIWMMKDFDDEEIHTYLGRPRHEIWIRREICPVLVLDPNTVIRSSVEVRPGKTDSVTLCDLDDLG